MQPIKYMTSLLTFYMKGEISCDQNFLNLKKPNTILKLIPLGAKKSSVPVNQLSAVESNFKVRLGPLVKGFFVALIGMLLMSTSFAVSAVLMLIAANIGITAFETTLTIKTTAGDTKDVSFLIFEKSKAEQAESQIRGMISNRLDDTNNRVQTDRIVDAINNK